MCLLQTKKQIHDNFSKSKETQGIYAKVNLYAYQTVGRTVIISSHQNYCIHSILYNKDHNFIMAIIPKKKYRLLDAEFFKRIIFPYRAYTPPLLITIANLEVR